MKTKLKFLAMTLIIAGSGTILMAQNHIANGEEIISGNRLISVKSENGQILHKPDRIFFQRNIDIDGRMNEPEWEKAIKVVDFTTETGKKDNSAVRILYDEKNIYLYWEVDQPEGITFSMKEKDGIITSDDYIQIDLKPWIPDSIIHGRDYYYSIAVNPSGEIWDSYFDPYLGGFYFSSWNSGSVIVTNQDSDHWQAEMMIPFSGLDVLSDPGWKWNLEFHHSTFNAGQTSNSSANIGVTVQQNIMVREKGLAGYFWPRNEFMQEIKPDMSKSIVSPAIASAIRSVPEKDGREDKRAWADVKMMTINHTDKMGALITSDIAYAKAGVAGNMICFNLKADGAKIIPGKTGETKLGDGMAGQMAGVNGVFVDQSLFQHECFWLILQPRDNNADKIHQDYYLIVINNRGEITGTHYDPYGAPIRNWEPKALIDLYNTDSGWGAEVYFDLSSFNLPVNNNTTWGINVFRNRLIKENESELQAWKFTGNDFLNPVKFGEISGILIKDLTPLRSTIKQETDELKSLLTSYGSADQDFIKCLNEDLNTLKTGTIQELNHSKSILEQTRNILGIHDALKYYESVPHPPKGKLPLMDVQFMDNYGWAVGAMGTILRTEDGGKSWDEIEIQSDADLYRVKFVNINEGWVAGGRLRLAQTNEEMRHDKRGGYAYIFHTRDGGKTWDCQYAEQGRHLFALDFVNDKIGYAAGERGFLLKTVDGGVHWNVLPTTGTLNWLYGMTFKDKDNGFAVGLNETVIKTSDGGKSWIKVDGTADRKFYDFRPIYRDISFSHNTGCIVGQNGSMLISHDGGETWMPSGTVFRNDIRELLDLRSVHFVTPERGYAVGELGTKIMTTEDGGLNWTYRSTNHSEWLRAVWGEPSGKVISVGEREKIMQSADYGFTWKQLNGDDTKIDILVMMAHGDDAPIYFNSFYAHYAINEGRKIVDVGVMSDIHSSEYEETYNMEHDRNAWMTGVSASSNFSQFETGNNGASNYHFNLRLWEGEQNVVWHMVAAIRAYKPDILITHDGVFGDYDKPGHKLSGRAGLKAFESAGGEIDHWPELTRLGLEPWQPKKLYNLASQSYPETVDLTWIADQPLKGTNITCREYGNYVIRNFQSQGVYYHRHKAKLSLVKSLVPVPEKEKTVFDGL